VVPERRQHPRVAPSSPQLVLLDESKYSLLFDLSENGLAIEGFTPHDRNSTISLEFDMPEASCCIQSKAEMVWTSDSGYRTGFRFLDLPDASRLQLRDWVATASVARAAVAEEEVASPALSAVPEPASPLLTPDNKSPKPRLAEPAAVPLQPVAKPFKRSCSYQDEDFDSEGGAPQFASIFVAAIVMSSLAFILGYYWHAGRSKAKLPGKTMAAASQPFERPASAVSPSNSTSRPSSAAQDAIPPVLPLDTPGFVLQVGAMGQEANADVLSQELRKKNFSAFVFHRGTDPFFRVAVGPYTDQAAAVKIQKDLQQEGYKPILRPWSPQ